MDKKSIRKNITIPEDFEERLERLMKKYGCSSISELIRFAVNKLEEAGHPAFQRREQEDLTTN